MLTAELATNPQEQCGMQRRNNEGKSINYPFSAKSGWGIN
jgi:hypothetical protein